MRGDPGCRQDPALLYVADAWSDSWFATVDGKEAPVLRANHAYRAIPVPAGTHTVAIENVARAADELFGSLLGRWASLAALDWSPGGREGSDPADRIALMPSRHRSDGLLSPPMPTPDSRTRLQTPVDARLRLSRLPRLPRGVGRGSQAQGCFVQFPVVGQSLRIQVASFLRLVSLGEQDVSEAYALKLAKAIDLSDKEQECPEPDRSRCRRDHRTARVAPPAPGPTRPPAPPRILSSAEFDLFRNWWTIPLWEAASSDLWKGNWAKLGSMLLSPRSPRPRPRKVWPTWSARDSWNRSGSGTNDAK